MKTGIKFLILSATIFCIGLFIYAEKKLSVFGEDFFNIFDPIPMNIEPCFNSQYQGAFVIENGVNDVIAGKEVCYNYNNSVIEINRVDRYYFNVNSFIAEIVSMNESRYFLIFSPSLNYFFPNNLNVKIKMNIDEEFLRKYECIDVVKGKQLSSNYGSIAIIALFLSIVLSSVLLILLFRKKLDKN